MFLDNIPVHVWSDDMSTDQIVSMVADFNLRRCELGFDHSTVFAGDVQDC